jgi:hypothetical protein
MTGTKRPSVAAKLQGQRHSEERCRNISLGKKGKTHKPIPPEARAKISASKKGKPLSETHRAKMSAAHRGKKRRPLSEQTRLKISLALKRKFA